MKICTVCKTEKPTNEFYTHKVNGYEYPRPSCKKCQNKKRLARITPEQKLGRDKRKNARIKEARATLPSKPRFLRADANRNDKHLGWTNDLTLEFVKALIKHGCFYCWASSQEVKMSLDRIDNAQPHNQNNVNASCVECNLTRGSMPYGAWLVVSKGMREARSKGLLNGWHRRA